ncbi:hypothetical protein HanIR_Chr02g0086111 [Helianthus annuus]|nr:hypothetical protein HanIR_Chr02g0086111 [Helianthus annuus]
MVDSFSINENTCSFSQTFQKSYSLPLELVLYLFYSSLTPTLSHCMQTFWVEFPSIQNSKQLIVSDPTLCNAYVGGPRDLH